MNDVRRLCAAVRSPRIPLVTLLATAAAVAVAAWPASALAATASCKPPPTNVPESPGGPVLLILMGLGVIGGLAIIRRRGGFPTALVSALAVVVVAGALLGTVAAGADSRCDPTPTPIPTPTHGGGGGGGGGGSGGGGGVLGTSTTTSSVPFSGADLPWIDAMILVGGGALLAVIAVPRRRRAPAVADPP